MSGFKVLCSVVIHHNFFASEFCDELNLEPSRATRAQAKNSGIIFRSWQGGGILVLYDSERIPVLQHFVENEGLILNFYVMSSNSYLGNYSSISLLKDKQLLWLKHDPDQGDDEINGIGSYKLHNSDYVSDENYYLKDRITGYDESETLHLPSNELMFISIKLNKQELNVLTNVADEDDPFGSKIFFATINSKSSFWEYRLNGNYINSKLDIIDKANDIEFHFVRNELLNGGRNISILRSNTEIKLKEFNKYNLQLIDKRTNGTRVLINRLPMANVNHGYQEMIGTKLAHISEIFVNF